MTSKTTPSDLEFAFILHLIETAVFLEVPLFQIREKNLPARMLYELVSRAVEITRDTSTRLLVNDRFDQLPGLSSKRTRRELFTLTSTMVCIGC